MNILVNAAQAVEGRGTITVTTALLSHEGKFQYLPGASQPKCQGFVRVTISDTGRGIVAEHLNHLFEPFFTTREVGQGMGLGLSTAYDIVKRHGGEVRVESEPGRGATFIMDIPVCPD
jgi:signal transduction histidine kinase